MGWVLKKFGWFFTRTFGISGAEAIVAAASPFIGQGENAILTKPHVKHFTEAEMHQWVSVVFISGLG
jgi:CNT family concentrative nucleoside transporter